MWIMTNGATSVLQVFRAPCSFLRQIPNPEYGKEVPEPANDATPEQQADYLIELALAEAQPPTLTVQEGEDVFTKWTDEERAAINIYRLTTSPVPERHVATVTGSEIVVVIDQDGTRGVENWLTVPPTPEDLITIKRGEASAKIAEIEGEFERLKIEGIEYPANSGRFLQMRDEDRANITARGSRSKFVLGGQGVWPNPFAWTMKDNLPLPLDAQGMSDMADAADDSYARWLYVRRAKKNAVLAMVEDPTKSVNDLRSLDVRGGWNV